jgi:hypothetical protein
MRRDAPRSKLTLAEVAVFRLAVGVCVRSVFKCRPARIADHDANHFYLRAVRTRDNLASCLCEACVNEACDHGAVESKDEQVLCDAVRNARE